MGANGYTINSLTGHDIPTVCGVYQITDTVTGKTYVGGSRNVRTRIIQHFYHMRNPTSRSTAYAVFSATYAAHGGIAFKVVVLEECAPDALRDVELAWITKLSPTENVQLSPTLELAFSEEERQRRAERTRKLWATPAYRERAVAARKGKTYSKGYKCTPEQVENRRRAARISNMKRKHGEKWRTEYVQRYPEHAGDVNAQ
jgi:group I intron endonuclease